MGWRRGLLEALTSPSALVVSPLERIAARLRARAPGLPGLPVVLASGFTHDVRVPELLKQRRTAFVGKPVRTEELRSALGQALQG